jgi:hypothetical protein
MAIWEYEGIICRVPGENISKQPRLSLPVPVTSLARITSAPAMSKYAIEVFRLNLLAYPDSADAHLSLPTTRQRGFALVERTAYCTALFPVSMSVIQILPALASQDYTHTRNGMCTIS